MIMKPAFLAAIVIIVSTTNTQVNSFFVPNLILFGKSLSKRTGETPRRHERNTLFGRFDSNVPEPSDKSKNFRTESRPVLDPFFQNYLNKYLPRSSTKQYFKQGSDLEEDDPRDDDVWTRALRMILPDNSPSENQTMNITQSFNARSIGNNNSNEKSFLPDIFDVEALLLSSSELEYNGDVNKEMTAYLQALLEQNKISDKKKITMQKNDNFNQRVNNTVSSILSYLEWGTSSLASSSPIKIEKIIEETTSQINFFFLRTVTTLMLQSDESLSPYINSNAIQDLIQNINVSSRGVALAMDNLLLETEILARENGLDVGVVVEEARENAQDLIDFGNAVLADGYVSNAIKTKDFESEASTKEHSAALFDDFDVRSVSSDDISNIMAGEMGNLAAAIYEESMVKRAHKLDQTIVASGSTCDVKWLVTDGVFSNINDISWDKSSSNSQHSLVRTITIKGFDATDENVDRERLLGNIWTATPETLSDDGRVSVHSGLLSIARGLYEELRQYLEGLAPSHKLILNGHSVGGSLSTLFLFILSKEKGADWVKERILKVYTFGAPPIAYLNDSYDTVQNRKRDEDLMTSKDLQTCDILASFDLPSTIVNGFCQPWDPCIRLFSSIDPIYPLLDDIGIDGNTLWASGPTRTLRPITRAIIESWENWPSLRDKYRETASQSYISAGTQYILLPETKRYLMDRLVSVNLAVPDTEVIVELPAKQLLPALNHAFPLDTFGISVVPAALRSFIHHFHPAYATTLDAFSKKKPLISHDGKVTKEEMKQSIEASHTLHEPEKTFQ